MARFGESLLHGKMIFFRVLCPIVFYFEGYFTRKINPMLIRKKPKHHVHAGTDTRGGIEFLVPHPTGLSYPLYFFSLRYHPIKRPFVRRGFAVIEQSCPCQ